MSVNFDAYAKPISVLALEGEHRLAQYRRVVPLILICHLLGAYSLTQSLSQLNPTRIIRSSYCPIVGLLLQGVFEARIRGSREGIEAKKKELRKVLKEEAEKDSGGVSKLAAQLFDIYKVWAAVSLKYGSSKHRNASDLARRCVVIRNERRRFKRLCKGLLVAAACFALPIAKARLQGILPVGIGGVSVSLALSSYFLAAKEWRRLEEVHLKEAIRRIVTVTNGKGIERDIMDPVLTKIKLKGPDDPHIEDCPCLKELSLREIGFSPVLPPDLWDKMRKLVLPQFSAEWAGRFRKLTRLSVSRVSGDEMEAIAKLPILRELSIAQPPSKLKLPARLEKLDIPQIPARTEGLNRLQYLRTIKLQKMMPDSAGVLASIGVLEELHIRDGSGLTGPDLAWLEDRRPLGEMRIDGLKKGTLKPGQLRMLEDHYLVSLKENTKVLPKGGLASVWDDEGKDSVDLVFKKRA